MAGSSNYTPIEDLEAVMDSFPIEEETPTPTSTQTRKKTSNVWKYFELIETNTSRKAKCKICHKEYAHPKGSGNGTLERHIKNNHRQKEPTQTQLSQTMGGQLGSFTYNKKTSREAWAKYIVRRERPFNMCDDEAWVDSMRSGDNPQHDRIPRTTMRSQIFQTYHDYKQVLIGTLASIPCKIALTSDIWTSPFHQFFLCVTAHYIDEDWVLQKRILSFLPLDSPHTGTNIGLVILQTLDEYQITNKIISITLDNASNNNRAVDTLKSRLQPFLDGRLFHQRCACHILNLCVRDGLACQSESIEKIRNSILYLKSSATRLGEFRRLCHSMGLRLRKFKIDVETRWNSTYDMLKSIEGFEEPLGLFINERHPNISLENSDFAIGKALTSYLELFYQCTKQFSGSYYPTVASILQSLVQISSFYQEYKLEPSYGTLINIMELKFLKYWERPPLLFCLATILDPRLKREILDLFLDNYAENFSADNLDIESLKEESNNTLYDMYNIYNNMYGVKTSSSRTHIGSSSSSGKTSLKSPSSFLVSFLGSSSKKLKQTETQNNFSEINFYLNRNILGSMSEDDISNFDLLQWWKANQSTYPVLAAMARDILSVPVSTVASEAAFSAGGRVLSPKRANLSFDSIQVCVCLKDWLDAEARKQDEDSNEDDDDIADVLSGAGSDEGGPSQGQ